MNKDPFPHIVIDDFLDMDTVRAINEEWPRSGWFNHAHAHSEKWANDEWDSFGKVTRDALRRWKRPEFVAWLSGLTGIPDLEPDVTLFGEGCHETREGGFLNVHVDFNQHPTTGLYRRVNMLVFLNPYWQEEWGGTLELWDHLRCKVRILPEAGRCVIFKTSEISLHGHPEPVVKGHTRRSLALYYYSPTPAVPGVAAHSTTCDASSAWGGCALDII